MASKLTNNIVNIVSILESSFSDKICLFVCFDDLNFNRLQIIRIDKALFGIVLRMK